MGKKSRFFLAVVFLLIVVLAAFAGCKKDDDGDTGTLPGDTENYEESMTWSESGHLYIHYKRYAHTESDYKEWSLWVWQNEPLAGEGATFNWFRYDASGAVGDIDLKATYMGGETGNIEVNYKNVTSIGFLIVLTSSKNKTSGMWTSDGSRNFYINDVPSHIRADGSLHIFAQQGVVGDYTFSFNGEDIAEDPFENIEPGSAVSKTDVLSSKTKYGKTESSAAFRNEVGVGYQIQVASFADSDGDGWGDIKGITENLDYLKNLNIGVLWLTPIQLSDSYHGYDIKDYYAVDPKFGTVEDYRELIYKAHKQGIKVIMDLVVNHTSSDNVWFKNSTRLKTDTGTNGNEVEYRSMYHWAYGDEYEGKASWKNYSGSGYYYYAKFADNMPELNYDYQGTRDMMMDVAYYWMSFGLDGYRIDAVKHIYMVDEVAPEKGDILVNDVDKVTNPDKPVDYSSNVTKNTNFFKEFNAKLKAAYPDAVIVGENFDGNVANTSYYYSGMDSVFNFNAYYNLAEKVQSPSGANTYASTHEGNLEKFNSFSLNDTAVDSAFTSNHDVTRMLNHVMGDKLVDGSNSAEAIKKAKVYSATILTYPGISWIYYGDELGMSGIKTDNILSDGSTNNYHADRWFRQPMHWSKDTSYEKYKYTTGYTYELYTVELDAYNFANAGVKEQLADSDSMLNHFMKLTDLKSNDEVLRKGVYAANATVTNDNIMAYTRTLGEVKYYVYHNYSDAAVALSLTGSQIIYSSNGLTVKPASLAGYSTIILRA